MATAARTGSRSGALTLLAWLLCVLLGPGPALPALHFALVAHRVCMEHGALEHVDAESVEQAASSEASSQEASLATAQSERAAGKSLAPGRGGADTHGHEQCGVAGVGGTVAWLPAGRAAVAPLEWLAPAAPHGAAHAHQGIALLSYAPKLPPPARA